MGYKRPCHENASKKTNDLQIYDKTINGKQILYTGTNDNHWITQGTQTNLTKRLKTNSYRALPVTEVYVISK